MTDPFAHGTPVGDFHTWVTPDRLDCPDCPCCTVGLCRVAKRDGKSCATTATSHGDFDMSRCPCAPAVTP